MLKVRKTVFLILSAIMLYALCRMDCALCEDGFRVRRIGNIVCFSENSFEVSVPEAGTLTIRIHDDVSVYREIVEPVSAGEHTIIWDGCGYNREKLYPKSYTVTALLDSDSGRQYSVSFLSPIEYTSQSLQYVLPSAAEASAASADEWFLEFRTVMKGNVVIRFECQDRPGPEYEYHISTVGGKLNRRTLSSIAGKNMPEPGRYTVTAYEATKPEDIFSFDLVITDKPPEKPEAFVTGEIMPERGMSDQEIWEIMMQPSVVVDIDFFKHQTVYARPDLSAEPLGTLHGQTQALKVLSLQDGWALIGAWNHEDATYVEGWVPSGRLKVEYPQSEYGLLIDKRKQTLTVYCRGEKLDTLLVSTGRPEYRKYDQETSAGSFLTGYHRVDFSMNGKKYDYVIQYDGGNLLHQTPYDWGIHKKDFTYGRGYLGTKASHACIRIQAEPGEGGLNAYWLWTHLPYHTRVIILDDAEERTENIRKLRKSRQFGEDQAESMICFESLPEAADSASVVITFGGEMTPGGRRSFNAREESLVSLAATKGSDWIFAALKPVFLDDDLTVVNLKGVLTEDQEVLSGLGEIPYAPASMASVFGSSSVEMVNLADDSFGAADGKAAGETAGAIRRHSPGVSVLNRGSVTTVNLKGHLFGFANCSESEYLKDPSVIDRRIGELREAGSEHIVILFSWGDARDRGHSVIQEAMAHRSIRAGADLVIGLHSSVLQGIDYIEDVPVVYGMGKLMDGSTSAQPAGKGILVRAVFEPEGADTPVRIGIIPVHPSGGPADRMNDYTPTDDLSPAEAWSVIRRITEDSTELSIRRTTFFLRNQ